MYIYWIIIRDTSSNQYRCILRISSLHLLKNQLCQCCHFVQVEAVMQSLNSVCVDIKTSTEEEWGELGMSSTGKNFIWMNFPKLVEQLKAEDKLPALVFR